MKATPIELVGAIKHEHNGTFTVTLTITGIPTQPTADRISQWLHKITRAHASEIGALERKQ